VITRDQVLQALNYIIEPTLKKSITDLSLVRDVVIREDSVSLTLVIHPESQQVYLTEPLTRELQEALRKQGVEKPHVRLRSMTEQEVENMTRQQAAKPASQGAPAEQQPIKGHGAGLEKLPLLHPNSPTTFIAIASGKGGVGKSTVTVNLAVALAREGKRVGLIDSDIYGFSIPDMMGIEERPDQEGEKIKPVERFGVKVMSMGFFVEDNSPVVWRGPMLGKMLRNFFGEVEWGELDYLLLDLPPGTGDIALDVHQMLPQSKEIIVTTPHATAAFVAARAGAMAIRTNHEIIGVVENMSYYVHKPSGDRDYIFGRGGGGKLAETLHTELLAQFPLGAPDNHPLDPDYSPSVYSADSETGQAYKELARAVIERCTKA
jgi:ATP-binding protein involved in chromosome partitioning